MPIICPYSCCVGLYYTPAIQNWNDRVITIHAHTAATRSFELLLEQPSQSMTGRLGTRHPSTTEYARICTQWLFLLNFFRAAVSVLIGPCCPALLESYSRKCAYCCIIGQVKWWWWWYSMSLSLCDYSSCVCTLTLRRTWVKKELDRSRNWTVECACILRELYRNDWPIKLVCEKFGTAIGPVRLYGRIIIFFIYALWFIDTVRIVWHGWAVVLPSAWLFHQSTAATAAGWFAAERPVGRRNQSIAAGDVQQASALSVSGAAAANAGSVMLTADVGSGTQTC